ncbi:MAG TPA: archease [Actinomycetota bacterium]|nr:archease [Actinomycetota bacterium]
MAQGQGGAIPPGPGAAGPGAPDAGGARPGGFELLEHTADVGIRAWAGSLEEAFEHATEGLAEVLGALAPLPGEATPVEVTAPDPGGLLVDWLNEVLWLLEVSRAGLAGVRVERVSDGVARGSVELAPGGPDPDGTFVKAVTYHRLRVESEPGGWLLEVYLDV